VEVQSLRSYWISTSLAQEVVAVDALPDLERHRAMRE
jgi:hypothetical protein